MSLLDPSVTFASLADAVGLDLRLRKAVSRLGHVRPTLVQSKCLPLAISSGRDLLVRARTGSGKTLAYCLPLLQKILQEEHTNVVRSVILVPTRELCTQVFHTLETLTYYCDEIVSLAVLSGGRSNSEKEKHELARQEAMLRDMPKVIVATPAGLLTHIRSGVLDLSETVETLVVDEADLVLSFGYANDITEVMKSLPKICQGFLMSATLSPELNDLKKIVLHSPAVLKLEEETKRKQSRKDGQLVQFYLALPKKDKNLVLYVFLKLGLLKGKGLFFVNSTNGGYRLKLFLEQFHIRSAVLNAELPLRSRLNIIEQFNIGNFEYLIATDESAIVRGPSNVENDSDEDEPKDKKSRRKDSEYGVSRGLDFRYVSFVVNVDFPSSPQSYTHRVGRTARGGAKGVALSLVDTESSNEQELLRLVQEEQPQIPITRHGNDVLQAASRNAEEGDNELPRDIPPPVFQQQPSPLEFNLQEIEGFRYRVEDVSRAVTKTAVGETRAAELRAEILNSDRLQNHFDDNPADLQLLRHDRVATHIAKVQDHLKHVPKYMLPRGMQVADLNRKRKRRRNKNRSDGRRRTDNDPLQSYDGDGVNLDSVEGEEGGGGGGDGDEFTEFFDDGEQGQKKDKDASEKVLFNTKDGTGRSTSGRSVWKEKHRKGKFSGKRRKSEAPRRRSGI